MPVPGVIKKKKTYGLEHQKWKSYAGEHAVEEMKYDEWSFDLDNPERVKIEGGVSSLPVIIPAPGNTTNARINFWILPWIAAGPTNNEMHEFIVRRFNFSSIE